MIPLTKPNSMRQCNSNPNLHVVAPRQVRLHSESGCVSEWAMASLDTAPSQEQWGDAAWIGGGSQLRADFDLPSESPVVNARAYVSGVGAFELHLNGAKVVTLT